MKKFTSALALMALASPAFAQQDIINQTFGDEVMPKAYTLVNRDGMGFQKRTIGSDKLLYFSGLTPEKTWFVGSVDDGFGNENSAAVSASRRDVADKATDNWLITPEFTVSDDCILRWDARSVHKGFPERYAVMISTSASDDPDTFVPLTQVEDESYEWATRFIDLKNYKGMKVRIAFVHNATNKYLLAIDNLRVGPLTDRKLKAVNYSAHFPGNVASFPVDIRIFNYGRALNVSKVSVFSGETELASSDAVNFSLPRASYVDIAVPVSLPANAMTPYTVKAFLDNGAEVTLLDDAVWTSAAPAMPVVEKFTGTWCNACARLAPLCQRIETHFGHDVILVEPHFDWTGADDMLNSTYGGELGAPLTFSDYPAMLFNRNQKDRQPPMKVRDQAPLVRGFSQPVPAAFLMQAVYFGQPGLARLVSYTTFVEDTDNADGHLKIGYAAVRKKVISGADQENGAVMLGSDFSEFSILPGKIPADALIHENVPVGECVPTGVANSLPAEIKGGTTYTHTHVIEFPDIPLDELFFVAYLIDSTGKYEILNGASARDILTEQAPFILTAPARIQAGTSADLDITSSAPLESLAWELSDPSIASVDDMSLTALSPGALTLTARDGEKTVRKEITVYDNTPQPILEESTLSVAPVISEDFSVSVSDDSLTIDFGHEAQFAASIYSIDGILCSVVSGNAPSASLSFDSLTPGLYILRASAGDVSRTFKFIVR